MTWGNNRVYVSWSDRVLDSTGYSFAGDHVVDFEGADWDGLWERLRDSLLNTLAVRRTKKKKGRPARGPGSERLGADEAERVKQVQDAIEHVAKREHRPAKYAEVARHLQISPVTLWRIRNLYGWPPVMPSALESR